MTWHDYHSRCHNNLESLDLPYPTMAGESALQPLRHNLLALLQAFTTIGSASNVVYKTQNCELTPRIGSELEEVWHVDGRADPEEQRSNPHPVPLIFPIFPGDVDPVDPSMAG